GICAGAEAAAGERAADGLALRAAPHADRARTWLARALRQLRADRRARRFARAGASREVQGRHTARLQAPVPRHGVGGGGRSAAASADLLALSTLRPRDPDRPDPRRA